jgi:hypothetical protein
MSHSRTSPLPKNVTGILILSGASAEELTIEATICQAHDVELLMRLRTYRLTNSRDPVQTLPGLRNEL